MTYARYICFSNNGGTSPFRHRVLGKNNKNGEKIGHDGEKIDGEKWMAKMAKNFSPFFAIMAKIARKSMARMGKMDGESFFAIFAMVKIEKKCNKWRMAMSPQTMFPVDYMF